MLNYDYVIIGAGISGSCVAYELSKHNDNILVIDKNDEIAAGASGAAGAFLSPLLGKNNAFKDLVTKSLKYSTKFYKQNFPKYFNNCGTTRIPKNVEDQKKFEDYIPFMDFEFERDNDGYFFKIGSTIESSMTCRSMLNSSSNNIKMKFGYEVKSIEYIDEKWLLNSEIKAKNIIYTTGSDVSLLDQFYLKIRAVWGQRIDISTSSKVSHNYHKACSLSQSKPMNDTINLVSIGATHHRNVKKIENIEENSNELLIKANDIQQLDNIKILNSYSGARACSVDYFPIVGEIINSKKTLEEFPYLKNGTHVEPRRFKRFKNAYILTGVGGRGFVLAPYLAKVLVENILKDVPLDKSITIDRLFQREVKRYTNFSSKKG